jgi:CHASE2 domain-containing sensor protein
MKLGIGKAMSKIAILELQGDFDKGFFANLRFGEKPNLLNKFTGYLPLAPEIPVLYKNWLSSFYNQLVGNSREIETPQFQVSNFSYSESCEQASQYLVERLNEWLRSQEFLIIQNKLREWLVSTDTLQLLLDTDNHYLQHLPWHKWEFLKDYPNAEIALINSVYRERKLQPRSGKKVKILAILGNSTNINIEDDKKSLEQLPDAVLRFLVEPSREEISDYLWEEEYDILFFAGHSNTINNHQNQGRIYINANDSLPIADFNSCDGLGLARDLAALDIPQTIVMRESVPDKVAQEFLKRFLREYSGGKTLYRAVREAREYLQKFEKDYPCVTWLPIIYQHPAHTPPTWNELSGNQKKQQVPEIKIQNKLLNIFVKSVIVTGLVLLGRSAGFLERFELATFDQLMLWRPREQPDSRILVVEATEKDIKNKFPIPDATLAAAIEKLDKYQPKTIGLDVFRPDKREDKLPQQFQQNKRLLAVCRVPDKSDKDNPGVEPPSAIPPERMGFADTIKDNNDDVIRRHLLFSDPQPETDSKCVTRWSLSALLASAYFGNKYQWENKSADEVVLGKASFKLIPLTGSFAGYHNIDGRGSQILLNYRASQKVAPTVTLSDVLNNGVKPELIKNRIVIIGVTAATATPDFHQTPYGKMPGVFIQAHKVSQIISAAEDGRLLLNAWSQPAEIFWIWGWSLIGGALVMFTRPRYCVIIVIIAGAALTGISFFLLIQGTWVPLLPSLLVLLITGGIVNFYTNKS